MDNNTDNTLIIMTGMLLLLSSTAVVMRKTIFRSKRRYKVRPMNLRNRKNSVYENLLNYAKNNDREQFFKYTRMSPEMFEHLLTLIGPYLRRDPSKLPIAPGQRLAITLQ